MNNKKNEYGLNVSTIINKNTGERYVSISNGDLYDVNPDAFYFETFFVRNVAKWGHTDEEVKALPPQKRLEILKNAINERDAQLAEINKAKVPDNMMALLNENLKKSDQQKLVKGLKLDPIILTKFVIEAFKTKGYLFTEINAETLPQNTDRESMPIGYRVKDDGTVEKIGETKLTDGQLKQIIKQRKVIIAKFVTKGDDWHCFITTYRSISGGETWENGQPHYHYLSSKYGFTREQVIDEIKKGKYPNTSEHIYLLDYGNQPSKN